MARKVSVEIVGDSASVERAFSNASRSATGFNRSVNNAERGASKSFRGFAAGTGVFRSLGRSLAFASGGFLAFAGASAALRDSITGADSLEKAQKGLDVAIEHTGGNVDVLRKKYAGIALAAQQFGINQADATTGLERATVLTGSAARAQRAYQEALVISKATGKDFNSVLTATSKGQEGVTTSLQRYGIEIKKGTPGQKQFQIVMGRFAGQAKASTTGIDRFNATLQNTEEIIGTALLPILNKYLGELGDWLDKMNRSGRLQHDVNVVVHDGIAVFSAIGSAIKAVDKVTGSFKNTLELLIGLKVASVLASWIGPLKALAAEFGILGGAAKLGGGAGIGALARGGAGGGGAVAAGRFAGKAAAIEAAAPFAPFLAIPALGSLSPVQGPKKLTIQGYTSEGQPIALGSDGKHYMVGARGYQAINEGQARAWISSFAGIAGAPVITSEARNFPRTGNILPSAFQAPGFQPTRPNLPPLGTVSTGPTDFGTKTIAQWAKFQLTISEQVAQAQAALTISTKDDVAVAKQIIARIKRIVDKGNLSGDALVQALQDEASAQSTIQSAQQAAAAKAQQAAAKAQAIASSFSTSIGLQIAQVEAEMTKGTADDARVLRRMIAQARAALASGKKNQEGRLAALQVILSSQQALQGLTGQTATSYTLPLKLQLQLAKAQATGKSIVPILLKMKAALERALKAAHGNIQKQIDIYNQIASVNSQLDSQTTSGLNGFKQASTKALTANLGLTEAQRKALRARLSQLGPNGTVPGQGVGAYGYAIGSNDRPIVIHNHLKVGEKEIGRSTSRYRQKHDRRNPTQRRGPNAATSTA